MPRAMLPEVRPSSDIYGVTAPHHFFGSEVPICGAAGDQQAALFGQACYRRRHGEKHVRHRLFHADEYGQEGDPFRQRSADDDRLGAGSGVEYALEGSIFVAGSAVQWLRDGLRMIETAAESEQYASKVSQRTAFTSCRRSSVSELRTGKATCAARCSG